MIISLSSAPGDYTSTVQSLTFSPTITQINVSIAISSDDINEAVEQFFASLSISGDVSIELDPLSAVIMIIDDDGEG